MKMKAKSIPFIVFLFITEVLCCQNSVMYVMDQVIPVYETGIRKKIKKKYGKATVDQYRHFLFIPFLSLKNIVITSDLFLSRVMKDSVMVAIKKQPHADNLYLSKDFQFEAFLYDDSLNVCGVINETYLSGFLPENQALLKFYSNSKAQLLCHIWGVSDLFVLIDNKIYKLVYDEGTNSFSKVEL